MIILGYGEWFLSDNEYIWMNGSLYFILCGSVQEVIYMGASCSRWRQGLGGAIEDKN